ncbi:DUF427 domain-containing protein [Mycobacterium tilburgii]|uniref:DUF427 domain-containing protein n=1 Tax=Mycobacterium tilburgii TaxID=44467 RepID=UPI0038992492
MRWDLFVPSDYSTVCPFKGRANYWALTSAAPAIENVVWAYRTPLPVGRLDRRARLVLRVVLVEHWHDGSKVPVTFPLWGDADELRRLIDV